MAAGLFALLDDVAALAKAAAASVDDIGAAAARASMKSAGVVVDDTAVAPTFVDGVHPSRELPIVRRIAMGSLRNKVVLILPAALVLSEVAPVLVELILMAGGLFLCFEGAHKVLHRVTHGDVHGDDSGHGEAPGVHAETHTPGERSEVGTAVAGTGGREGAGPGEVDEASREAEIVGGAIRTDLILSGEIMVIALKDVADQGFVSRTIILLVVAFAVTLLVYGVVALIVKMDDVGLHLVARAAPGRSRLGSGLVAGMPKVLSVLSTVGTAAMLWVGGHILIAGTDELGWAAPAEFVHSLEHHAAGVAGVGGVLGWLTATLLSAVVGVVLGGLVTVIVQRVSVALASRKAAGASA